MADRGLAERAGTVVGLASTGGAIGSLGGPIGTAIGTGAGALIGLGAELYDYFRSQGDDPATAAAKARQYDVTFVPTGIDFRGQAGQAFDAAGAVGRRQTGLADALTAQMEGRGGPSPAELQLRAAYDANARQAASLIGAQRGLNPGLAARLGSQAQSAGNAQANQQAAILRAQEQQAAQGLLAQALQAQRAGDISLYGTGAQGATQEALGRLHAAQGNQRAQLEAAELAQRADDAAAERSQRANAALAQGAGAVGALGATRPRTAAPIGDGLMDVNFATGGMVPGSAPVRGDSPRNDRVRAMLSPGEVVIPRSIVDAEDAPDRAAAFVGAVLRAHRGKKAA